MSYTTDYKEKHIDLLYEWVMDKKHDDMNQYFCGDFYKDNYEEQVDAYIDTHYDALWLEFFNLFGR